MQAEISEFLASKFGPVKAGYSPFALPVFEPYALGPGKAQARAESATARDAARGTGARIEPTTSAVRAARPARVAAPTPVAVPAPVAGPAPITVAPYLPPAPLSGPSAPEADPSVLVVPATAEETERIQRRNGRARSPRLSHISRASLARVMTAGLFVAIVAVAVVWRSEVAEALRALAHAAGITAPS